MYIHESKIRIYDGSRITEIEWIVGPIPIEDNLGKEIIVRYDTDIQSDATFYSDSNGREVLEHKRDYRPSWNYIVYENVSGNYYPIPSRIWIKDNQRQLTIPTDRSEDGSSMHDGSIELMVHRRTLHDDFLLVKHFLLLEPPESSAFYHRNIAQRIFMSPLGTYALPNVFYDDYTNSYRQIWSAFTEPLPYNVYLLTFDQLPAKIFLIRVEHYFELNEDEIFSKPVQFDLQILFNRLGKISELLELTLGDNLPLSEMKRLVWTTNNNESSYWQPTGMKKKCIYLNRYI
ncbi:unnamed protein product [Rotaria socialis]|uniref:Glycosyl hydrolase family 38 C-terminal domain-containing protein n=1 Tax=Rotaria socialis TaxID=392032 RepID=A0A818EX32_9BILA|nr:unnamed protein product [Rotaria socialis]